MAALEVFNILERIDLFTYSRDLISALAHSVLHSIVGHKLTKVKN